MKQKPLCTPLPGNWSVHVKSAVLHAASMAHAAVILTRSWCVNSPIARVRLAGELERAQNEIAVLWEIIRILTARMAKIEAPERPHYQSADRLAILELRAAKGWSLAETARIFQVEPETIATWDDRVAEQGEKSLVRLPCPVNKFPDYVGYLTQRLKAICPVMGKKSIALNLAHVGLHLAATTVRRFVSKRLPPRPPEAADMLDDAAAKTVGRVVTAKYPNHVWHVDLTVVPTTGFWTTLFPNALPQCWPFCYWLLVVVDHFSRAVIGFAIYLKPPNSPQVCADLDRLASERGVSSKYTVTDRGTQFDCEHYLTWCKNRDKPIKPRFGAVGKFGSIAVIERFILTLKEGCIRRLLVPLAVTELQTELNLFVCWYNQYRPHQSLDGRTPIEVYTNARPANRKPRFEPRPHWPRGSPCAAPWALVKGKPGARIELCVSFLEGRRHLPIVELHKAA